MVAAFLRGCQALSKEPKGITCTRGKLNPSYANRIAISGSVNNPEKLLNYKPKMPQIENIADVPHCISIIDSNGPTTNFRGKRIPHVAVVLVEVNYVFHEKPDAVGRAFDL